MSARPNLSTVALNQLPLYAEHKRNGNDARCTSAEDIYGLPCRGSPLICLVEFHRDREWNILA